MSALYFEALGRGEAARHGREDEDEDMEGWGWGGGGGDRDSEK